MPDIPRWTLALVGLATPDDQLIVFDADLGSSCPKPAASQRGPQGIIADLLDVVWGSPRRSSSRSDRRFVEMVEAKQQRAVEQG